MYPRFAAVLPAAALLVLATHASAQIPSGGEEPVPQSLARSWEALHGARVRVSRVAETDVARATIGRLLGSRADTLILQVDGASDPVHIVAEPAIRVEEWRRSDPTRAFTGLGLLLGGVAGGMTAAALNDPPESKRCEGTFDDLGSAAGCAIGAGLATTFERAADDLVAISLGAVLGAAVGAVGGRLLGRSMVAEGWRDVSPVRLRVSPRAGGGTELGLRWTR